MPVPIHSSTGLLEMLMNDSTAASRAARVGAPGCANACEPPETAGAMATRASVGSATESVARCRTAVIGCYLTAAASGDSCIVAAPSETTPAPIPFTSSRAGAARSPSNAPFYGADS